MHRRTFLTTSLKTSVGLAAGAQLASRTAWLAQAAEESTGAGPALELKLRSRRESPAGSGRFGIAEEAVRWDGKRTAAIVCDMWDLHHCKNATERVGELASRMNEFLEAARARGVFVIHAPSSCMKAYESTPGRARAKSARPAANLPPRIHEWCDRIPAEEKGKYPIDQSDGGCDSDGERQKAFAQQLASMGRKVEAPWLRQIDVLKIKDEDAISDSGVEIWNLLEELGITNVMLMGVHTNMCVLGRPFGLRQMARHGKKTVLIRDLTDTMYNPKAWPHVSHFEGTDLIIEHIEKFVCPTTTSVALLGGTAFRFRDDARENRLTA